MINTIWAVVKNGQILPHEPVKLHDGQRVLVTILTDEEIDFWVGTTSIVLDAIWDNAEDDIYAELPAAWCGACSLSIH